jgi:DNA-binding response OmpR family regulator
MDSLLSIAGLALSIAALVPALFPSTRVKFWTFTVGALSLVVLIGAYQAYKGFAEMRAVQASENQILELLTKNKNGLSFEQIYDGMYYPDFAVANTAIDNLVSNGRVLNEKIEASGPDGTKFIVRRFYRRFN